MIMKLAVTTVSFIFGEQKVGKLPFMTVAFWGILRYNEE